MKRGWLIYDESDLATNRDFASYLETKAPTYGLRLETLCTRQLELGIADGGALRLRKDGVDTIPDFVISRQRDAFVSAQLEGMGVPVFNNSKVCALCNDKRVTHPVFGGHSNASYPVCEPSLCKRTQDRGLSADGEAGFRAWW